MSLNARATAATSSLPVTRTRVSSLPAAISLAARFSDSMRWVSSAERK